MSAGAGAFFWTPNLNWINRATVTATLERMNSIPALARLLTKTSSMSTMNSASNALKLIKLIEALPRFRSMLIDDAANDIYTRVSQNLHRGHQLRLLSVISP